MTEREKIIDVLNKNFTQDVECTPIYTTAQGKEVALPQELCDIFNDIVTQAVIPYFADALIAAGIGDVTEWKEKAKKHRVQVLPDGTIKQLYSDEEVEDIARQRDKYKHRAEVAERALENACVVILSSRNGDQPRRLRAYYKAYLEAAEKELAEEGK